MPLLASCSATPYSATSCSATQGRGEATRLALVLGHIPFEDDRIDGADWMAIKPKTPYGSLPLLTVDGQQLAQSGAMLRYVGALGGLYPRDLVRAALADEVVDAMADLVQAIFRYTGSDTNQLREARETMVRVDVPRYWGGVDRRLQLLDDDSNAMFALGGHSPSIADVSIFSVLVIFRSGMFDFLRTDALDAYPRMMRVFKAMCAIPDVVQWYQKHPVKNVTIG